MAAVSPEQILDALSKSPYMTVGDLVACYRWPETSTRALINRAEEAGLIASVPHALLQRNRARRYCLTGEGVKALSEMREMDVSDLMARRGATYKGLSYLRPRLDILACAYRVCAAITGSYESGAMPMKIYTGGPVDAVVHLPRAAIRVSGPLLGRGHGRPPRSGTVAKGETGYLSRAA